MEQQLKQRLVGVAVIFSMAIIFLPMLLDGSGSRPKHLKISIPPAPEISSYEIVEDKIVELKTKIQELPPLKAVIIDEVSEPPLSEPPDVTNAKQVEQKTQIKPVISAKVKQEATVKTKPIVLTEIKKEPARQQTGGISWVIQAGSFSDKNKAYKLRDKLRKSTLAAVFIEKFKHDGLLSYRVRMGPFIKRDKARVIANKVRAKYNIKGLVMRYEK